MNSENETEEHIFSSDRPIQKESEDLLDRAHFSKELSKSLLSWKEDDSLVVGVYGKWGGLPLEGVGPELGILGRQGATADDAVAATRG